MAGKSKRPIKPASEFGRDTCLKCFRVTHFCLCATIAPFQIEPLIVLLVHPREFMKTVGTVRIVKLALTNSKMWRGFGTDFDRDASMNALLNDPTLHSMVLFPGPTSVNLSTVTQEVLKEKIPADKRLVIFVIDGTWDHAKNMINQSKILSTLPRVSFQVKTESVYVFRKQPAKYCLSTVEAVTTLIDELKQLGLCNPSPANAHHLMIKSFQTMVANQVQHEKKIMQLTNSKSGVELKA